MEVGIMRNGGASLSDDGLYRYNLWRRWGERTPVMTFIMLNPSTADAEQDDPTVRRCIKFAEREGCHGIEVINLFALRCTKPGHLLDHPEPEGQNNQEEWRVALEYATGPVVAAWGGHYPTLRKRGLVASEALEKNAVQMLDWKCLGHTADESPRHPLYLKADTPLEAL